MALERIAESDAKAREWPAGEASKGGQPTEGAVGWAGRAAPMDMVQVCALIRHCPLKMVSQKTMGEKG